MKRNLFCIFVSLFYIFPAQEREDLSLTLPDPNFQKQLMDSLASSENVALFIREQRHRLEEKLVLLDRGSEEVPGLSINQRGTLVIDGRFRPDLISLQGILSFIPEGIQNSEKKRNALLDRGFNPGEMDVLTAFADKENKRRYQSAERRRFMAQTEIGKRFPAEVFDYEGQDLPQDVLHRAMAVFMAFSDEEIAAWKLANREADRVADVNWAIELLNPLSPKSRRSLIAYGLEKVAPNMTEHRSFGEIPMEDISRFRMGLVQWTDKNGGEEQ